MGDLRDQEVGRSSGGAGQSRQTLWMVPYVLKPKLIWIPPCPRCRTIPDAYVLCKGHRQGKQHRGDYVTPMTRQVYVLVTMVMLTT